MDLIQPYLRYAGDFLKNPYVIGVLSILAIVYGSMIAPQLPPMVAKWFENPIFKVLFIFLILAVRNINPMIAIILTIGFVVSIQTLNRYHVFSMANEVSQMTAQPQHQPQPHQIKSEHEKTMPYADGKGQIKTQNVPDEEATQMSQEISDELKKDTQAPEPHEIKKPRYKPMPSLHPMNQAKLKMRKPFAHRRNHMTLDPIAEEETTELTQKISEDVEAEVDAKDKPIASLHPMNRPTAETTIQTHRVEDPNDPNHPGWWALNAPNVDVSLYELNPPYLRKNLPNQFRNAKGELIQTENPVYPPQYENLIKPRLISPKTIATRYSAVHGYPVLPEEAAVAQQSIVEGFPDEKMMRDINDNMPSPVVPHQFQHLPKSFLDNDESQGLYVSAKLNPTNDASMGPQGLNYQVGYQKNKISDWPTNIAGEQYPA